ncbi:MAG TPA: hypothetical protein VFB60_17965 [Ktedonobacteraceae bacterium]|nr:hypothetical protein [Ktedonobacteraceae bacterium]
MILPPLPSLLITLGISLLIVALGIVWLDARRSDATKTTQSWYETVSGQARGPYQRSPTSHHSLKISTGTVPLDGTCRGNPLRLPCTGARLD